MASWEYPKHKEFPKLPEDLSSIDPSDKQAVLDAREAFIRERWIKVMETKLMRKQLRFRIGIRVYEEEELPWLMNKLELQYDSDK
ncbi:650_t:CDS:2, partial [Ambispora leptoticha]